MFQLDYFFNLPLAMMEVANMDLVVSMTTGLGAERSFLGFLVSLFFLCCPLAMIESLISEKSSVLPCVTNA